MKSKCIIIGIGALVSLGVVLWVMNFLTADEDSGVTPPAKMTTRPEAATRQPGAAGTASPSHVPFQPQGHESFTEPSNQASPEEARNAVLDKIQDASTTYDPASLPIIEPYLWDADPLIRQEAIYAMRNMGEKAAAPMLRRAAEDAETPQEAVQMNDVADFLELPPIDIQMLKKRAQQTKDPNDSPTEEP